MKGDKQHNECRQVLMQFVEANNGNAEFYEHNDSVLGVVVYGRVITYPTRIMKAEQVKDFLNDFAKKESKKGRPIQQIE